MSTMYEKHTRKASRFSFFRWRYRCAPFNPRREKGPMRKFVPAIVTLVICLVLHVALTGQERISPTDAANYIGKPATVCGQVASATFAARSRGRPTFLNLDRPYPTRYSQ